MGKRFKKYGSQALSALLAAGMTIQTPTAILAADFSETAGQSEETTALTDSSEMHSPDSSQDQEMLDEADQRLIEYLGITAQEAAAMSQEEIIDAILAKKQQNPMQRAQQRAAATISTTADLTGMVQAVQSGIVFEDRRSSGISGADQDYTGTIEFDMDLSTLLGEARTKFEEMRMGLPNIAGLREAPLQWTIEGPDAAAPVVSINVALPEGYAAQTGSVQIDSAFVTGTSAEPSQTGSAVSITLNRSKRYGELFDSVQAGTAGTIRISIPVKGKINQGDSLQVSAKISGSSQLQHISRIGAFDVSVDIPEVTVPLITDTQNSWKIGEVSPRLDLDGTLTVNGKKDASVMANEEFSVQAEIDASAAAKELQRAASRLELSAEDFSQVALTDNAFEFQASFVCDEGINPEKASAVLSGSDAFTLTDTKVEGQTVTVSFSMPQMPDTLDGLKSIAEQLGVLHVELNGLQMSQSAKADSAMNITGDLKGTLSSKVDFPEGGYYLVNYQFGLKEKPSAQIKLPAPIDWQPIEVNVATAVQAGEMKPGEELVIGKNEEFAMTGILDTSPIKDALKGLIGDHDASSISPESIKVGNVSFSYQAEFSLPEGVNWDEKASTEFTGSSDFEVRAIRKEGDKAVVEFGLKHPEDIHSLNDLIRIAKNTDQKLVLKMDGFSLGDSVKNAQTFKIEGKVGGQLKCQVVSSADYVINMTVDFKDEQKQSASIKAFVVSAILDEEIHLSTSLKVNDQNKADVQSGDLYRVKADLDAGAARSRFDELLKSFDALDETAQNQIRLENPDLVFQAEISFPSGTVYDGSFAEVKMPSQFVELDRKMDEANHKLSLSFGIRNLSTLKDLAQAMNALSEDGAVSITVSNLGASAQMSANSWKSLEANISGTFQSDVLFEQTGSLYKAALSFTADPAQAQLRRIEPVILQERVNLPASVSAGDAAPGSQFRTRPLEEFALSGSIDTSSIKSQFESLVSQYEGLYEEAKNIKVDQSSLEFRARVSVGQGISLPAIVGPLSVALSGSDAFAVAEASRDLAGVNVTIRLKDSYKIETLADLISAAAATGDTLTLTIPGCSIVQSAKPNQVFEISGQLEGALDCVMKTRTGIPAEAHYQFKGTGDQLKTTVIAEVPSGRIEKNMKLAGSMSVEGKDRCDVKTGENFSMTSTLDVTPIAQLFDAQLNDKSDLYEQASNVKVNKTDFSFTAEYDFPAGTKLDGVSVSLPDNCPFKASIDPEKSGAGKLAVLFSLKDNPATLADLLQDARDAGTSITLSVDGLQASDSVRKNTDLEIEGTVTGHLNTEIDFGNYIFYQASLTFDTDPVKAAYRVLETIDFRQSMDIAAWIAPDQAKSGQTFRRRSGALFAMKGSIDTSEIRKAMDLLVNAGTTSSVNPSRIPIHSADLTFTAAFSLPEGMSWSAGSELPALSGGDAFQALSVKKEGSDVIVTLGLKDAKKIQTLQDLIDAAKDTPETLELTLEGFSIQQEAEEEREYVIGGSVNGELDAILENGDGIPFHMVLGFNGIEEKEKGSLSAKVLNVLPSVISRNYDLTGSMSIDGQAKKDLRAGEDFSVISTLDITQISEIFDEKLGNQETIFKELSQAPVSKTEFGFTADYTFPAGTDLSQAKAEMTKAGPFALKTVQAQGNKLTVTFAMKEQPATMGDFVKMAQEAGSQLELTIRSVKTQPSIAKNRNLVIAGDVSGVLKTDVAVADDVILRPEISFALPQKASASIRVLETVLISASEEVPAWISVEKGGSAQTIRKRVNKPFAIKGSIDTSAIREAMDTLVSAGSTSSVNPAALLIDQASLLFTAEFTVPEGMSWRAPAQLPSINASSFQVLEQKQEGSKVLVTIGFKDAQKISSLQDLIDAAQNTPQVIELNADGFVIADDQPAASDVYTVTGNVSGSLNVSMSTGEGIPCEAVYAFSGKEVSDKGKLSAKISPVVPTVLSKNIALEGSMDIDGEEKKDLAAGQDFSIHSTLDITEISKIFNDQFDRYGNLFDEFSKAALSRPEFSFLAEYSLPDGTDLSGVQAAMDDDCPFEADHVSIEDHKLSVTFSMKQKPETMGDLLEIAKAAGDSLELTVSNIRMDESAQKNVDLTVSGTVSGSFKAVADVSEETILQPEITFSMDQAAEVSIRIPAAQKIEQSVGIPSWISAGSKQPGEVLHVENGDEFSMNSYIDLSAASQAVDTLIQSGVYDSALKGADISLRAAFELPEGVNWNGDLSSVELSDSKDLKVVSAKQEDGKVILQIGLKDPQSIRTLEDLRDILEQFPSPLAAAVQDFFVSDEQMDADSSYTIRSSMSGSIGADIQDHSGLPYHLQLSLEGKESEGSLEAILRSVKTESVEKTFDLDGTMSIENKASFDTVTGDLFFVENKLNIAPVVDALNAWIEENAAKDSPDSQSGKNIQFRFQADYTFPKGTDLSDVKAVLHGCSAFKVDSLEADGNILHVTIRLDQAADSLKDLQEIANRVSDSKSMRLRLSQIQASQDMKANTWQDISASASGSFDGTFQISEELKKDLHIRFNTRTQTVQIRRQQTIESVSTLDLDTNLSVNSSAAGTIVQLNAGDTAAVHGSLSTARLKEQINALIKTHGEDALLENPSLTFTALFSLPSEMEWNGTRPNADGFKTVSAFKENGQVQTEFVLDLSKTASLKDLKNALDALPAFVKVTLPDVKLSEKAAGKKLAAGFTLEGRLETRAVQSDGTPAKIETVFKGRTDHQDLLKVAPVKKPDQPSDPAVEKQAMYRLYNPNSGEHFYTASLKERDAVRKAGWKYEGIGWYAPKKSGTPVYRLYNANAGDHHYTTEAHERDVLISMGWKDEGIGWYSDDAQSVPLYREYNPNAKTGAHNFTTSIKEHEYLMKIGWAGEGISWYGVK